MVPTTERRPKARPAADHRVVAAVGWAARYPEAAAEDSTTWYGSIHSRRKRQQAKLAMLSVFLRKVNEPGLTAWHLGRRRHRGST
jgi:hypothetical protein